MVPGLKVLVFLILHLWQDTRSSKVHLNNNGYEGVVIAINPNVREDERLITSLKEMVTQASTYLFEATGRRFYFRNVSVLVPITWKSKTEYLTPKRESYDQADVIVADPHLKYSDDPYTLQYGQCGDRGQYIHFTPNFLLNDNLSIYGPRGRVFVHEWAHLRWGVFDEYSKDQPFYSASSKKIEATSHIVLRTKRGPLISQSTCHYVMTHSSEDVFLEKETSLHIKYKWSTGSVNQVPTEQCSTGITGVNKVHKCQGGSCITRNCRRNSTTQLYERECQFFPDKVQTEKSSIMFMQSIDSVTEFCKEENHNREAPTLHNQKCDYRSTWEVISNSEDFKNSRPMEMLPSPPFFSLLRISERILCLVLDVSGSMASYDRLNRMNQAAKYFLNQIFESRSWVGMVHFESLASTKSELIQINSDVERNKLLETLPKSAGGGTSICSGIRTAFQVFKNAGFQTDGTEILLLSDGEDSTAHSCINEVKNSGAILHFIALGPSADKSVTNMTTITGGKHLFASDLVQNNGLIDAFGALALENADVTQKSLQLESKGAKLTNSRWLNDTVIIDSTVGKDTYFLVTWSIEAPAIHLTDPKGTQITNFTIDRASKMAYLSIPGIAEVGVWTYNLEAKVASEILTITVTSRASSSSVPPLTVNAKVNTDTNSYPSPMIVYAEVLQGYTPIIGARVTATIESSNGKTEELVLLDNGAGADAFKDDGVYSRYFTAYSDNGRYSVKVRADGGTNSARRSSRHPSSRAAYIPGWVVDGEIQGNPPRPETTEVTQPVLENFSRTASGGAFVMSNVPPGPLPDQFPPNQITDLQATLDGEKISLTWTAPGDDFDVGRVQQYTIRTSENIIYLRDNFNKSLQVNTTHLIPKEANSKETFAFKPKNMSGESATYLFIAIESVDKSNLRSRLSNIAQVALFSPQAEPIPEESPQSGVSVTTIVLSVVGSVLLVCIIVSTTICILKRKRSSSGAATTC